MNSIAGWSCKQLSGIGLLCFVLLAAFACSTLRQEKSTEENLVRIVEDFNNALRWGDYKLASSRVAPPLQGRFWRQADELQDSIRVTEYDVRDVLRDSSRNSVEVTIRYHFYETSDPQLRTTTLRQRWQYVEELKGWMLVQFDMEPLMPKRR